MLQQELDQVRDRLKGASSRINELSKTKEGVYSEFHEDGPSADCLQLQCEHAANVSLNMSHATQRSSRGQLTQL